jgi:hypothetical protein
MIGMGNFFDKKEVEQIKMLNASSGNHHRFRPYDLNNPEDMAEMLEFSIGEYCDCMTYLKRVESVRTSFAEIVETTGAKSWLEGKRRGKNFVSNTSIVLKSVKGNLERLSAKATDRCMNAMRIALEAPPQHQERIFGRTHSLDTEKIEEFVATFFEQVRHSSFHYEIRKNYEDFVKLVNAGLNVS